MCNLILIAADHALPPTTPFRDGSVFSGNSVTEGDEPALAAAIRTLGRRHCVVVGAHQGCGCGFSYSSEDEQAFPPGLLASLHTNPEALAGCVAGVELGREASLKGRRSVLALREYLARAAAGGPVELFVASDGVWPPERNPPRLRVGPSHFADDLSEFGMETWTHYAVSLDPQYESSTSRRA